MMTIRLWWPSGIQSWRRLRRRATTGRRATGHQVQVARKPPGLPAVPTKAGGTEESAVAPKSSGPSVTEEEYDVDEDGLPILPAGCCVGAFCLAYGTNAGQRKQFKAKIMAVRELYPHVLVKYVGDASGSTSALLLPEVRNSYVAVREVQAWQRLVTPPTEVDESSFNGGGSTDEETVRRPSCARDSTKTSGTGSCTSSAACGCI